MSIPKMCELNRPIFKKLFLERGVLDTTDQKTLKEDITSIRWLYTLKPSTINISKFEDETVEYHEIAILQIDLTNLNRVKRIGTFVNKAIPYPIILLFRHNEKFAISVANKRTNQADITKWIIDDELITDWISETSPTEIQKKFINDCSLNNLSSLNFYAFYQDVIARVTALIVANRNGSYDKTSREKTAYRLEALAKITKLESQVVERRTNLKKEKQFNRKLELNILIKEHQAEIEKLIKEL